MKILYKILGVMLILLLVPLAILGYNAVSTTNNVGIEINEYLTTNLNDQAKDNMEKQAIMLANHAESQLRTYMNDIKTIIKHPELPNLMKEARDMGVLEDTREVEGLDKADQVAHFYPTDKSGSWQIIQDYFMNIYDEREKDIDLIRIFYDNGFVVNGVALGEEDTLDYKGDKSWFADTMNPSKTKSTDYYVSPISIARRTDSPAIRYMAPLEVDGERLGLIIINFKSSTITKEVQEFEYGDSAGK